VLAETLMDRGFFLHTYAQKFSPSFGGRILLVEVECRKCATIQDFEIHTHKVFSEMGLIDALNSRVLLCPCETAASRWPEGSEL